jgi:hypothetical protein
MPKNSEERVKNLPTRKERIAASSTPSPTPIPCNGTEIPGCCGPDGPITPFGCCSPYNGGIFSGCLPCGPAEDTDTQPPNCCVPYSNEGCPVPPPAPGLLPKPNLPTKLSEVEQNKLKKELMQLKLTIDTLKNMLPDNVLDLRKKLACYKDLISDWQAKVVTLSGKDIRALQADIQLLQAEVCDVKDLPPVEFCANTKLMGHFRPVSAHFACGTALATSSTFSALGK